MAQDHDLNATLRSGTQAQVAAALKIALDARGSTWLGGHLLASVASGAIPPTVFRVFLPLSRDPDALAQALRQPHSVHVRYSAMVQLGRAFRSDALFAGTWSALGGVVGLASIMRELAISEVGRLCRILGRTSTVQGPRDERRARLAELVRLLGSASDAPATPAAYQRDPRPLEPSYAHLVEACEPAFIAEWHAAHPTVGLDWAVINRADPEYHHTVLADWLLRHGKHGDLSRLRHLLAASLRFHIHVLELVTDTKNELDIAPSTFVESLATPLVCRLYHRHASYEAKQRVFGSILGYLQARAPLPDTPHFKKHGLLYHAAKWWNGAHNQEQRTVARKYLGALISLAPAGMASSLDSILGMLQAVRPLLRYDLLCLILLHAKSFKVDIVNPKDADRDRLKQLPRPWPCELFLQLPAAKSLELLDLLERAFPSTSFVTIAGRSHKTSVLHKLDKDQASWSGRADPLILRTLLTRNTNLVEGRGQWLGSVENSVEERMKKATQSREQTDRAYWAESALLLSVASGSLDLYSKTLLWARRFNKDPMTVRQLYALSVVQTQEGLDLLCALPKASSPLETVRANVLSANKILLDFLETASMGLREPGFSPYDWYSVRDLIPAVLQARLSCVDDYQKLASLSDDVVLDVVWRPTIEMVLAAEKFMLADGHEALDMNSTIGIFRGTVLVKNPSNSTWRALDALAEARDLIWREHRSKARPDVLTLPAPWPKGLPVQALCPIEFPLHYNLPYVQSAAKVVVFSNPAEVMGPPPKDKETTAAIGTFVNNYKAALSLYVNGHEANTDRHTRIQLAWAHALQKLSAPRLSKLEAAHFWHSIFTQSLSCLPTLEGIPPSRPSPTIPQSVDVGEPTEWHPDPAAKALEVAEKTLDWTVIDWMLNSYDTREPGGNTLDSQMNFWKQPTVSYMPESFWNMSRLEYPLSGTTRDAMIAAAVLGINSKQGSDSSILMSPCPSSADPRFPGMYLDQEFLESACGAQILEQVAVLKKLIRWTPPGLLARLVSSVCSRLKNETTDSRQVRQAAVGLVKLLSKSDRPSLACQFVRDIILDWQTESAWHRQLFTPGFFCALSSSDARQFLEDISDGICVRLSKQAQYVVQASQEPSPRQENGPAVKVTTVKMLAQLLRPASFIDPHDAGSILVALLNRATHIDIRVAILQSLMDMFQNTTDETLRETVFAAMEARIIPMFASLNERRPTTEDEWAKAETGGDLPEVGDTTNNPLTLILMNSRYTIANMSIEWQQRWLQAVVLPILQQSTDNNMRWIELFLQHHQIDVAIDTVPRMPRDLQMPAKILQNWPKLAPASVFEQVRQIVLSHLDPPPVLVAATKTLKELPGFSSSNSGSHWLSLWSDAGEDAYNLGGKIITKRLAEPAAWWEEGIATGITVKMIQDFVLEMAESMIMSSNLSTFSSLVDTVAWYDMGPWRTSDRATAWKANSVPVLERIIAGIDELRTDEWQKDHQRHPRVLPDTFGVRVKALCFPVQADKGHEISPEEGVLVFATEIENLIDILVKRQEPYHNQWPEVLKTVESYSGKQNLSKLYAHIAVRLGSLGAVASTPPTTADYLRVELAAVFLKTAADPEDVSVARAARVVVGEWEASSIEAFRNAARDVWASFRPGAVWNSKLDDWGWSSGGQKRLWWTDAVGNDGPKVD